MKYCLIVVCLALFVEAQDKPKYQPSEIQSLRLQLRQKDLIIARQNFNIAAQALNEEAIRVKIENKWPDDLEFNQERLTFADAPKESGRIQ